MISQRDLATGRVIREERLDRDERVTAVSLDGRQLLIHESSEGKDWRCRIENLSDDPARPRMVSQIDLLNPHVHVAAFSPDGRLAAFAGMVVSLSFGRPRHWNARRCYRRLTKEVQSVRWCFPWTAEPLRPETNKESSHSGT